MVRDVEIAAAETCDVEDVVEDVASCVAVDDVGQADTGYASTAPGVWAHAGAEVEDVVGTCDLAVDRKANAVASVAYAGDEHNSASVDALGTACKDSAPCDAVAHVVGLDDIAWDAIVDGLAVVGAAGSSDATPNAAAGLHVDRADRGVMEPSTLDASDHRRVVAHMAIVADNTAGEAPEDVIVDAEDRACSLAAAQAAVALVAAVDDAAVAATTVAALAGEGHVAAAVAADDEIEFVTE